MWEIFLKSMKHYNVYRWNSINLKIRNMLSNQIMLCVWIGLHHRISSLFFSLSHSHQNCHRPLCDKHVFSFPGVYSTKMLQLSKLNTNNELWYFDIGIIIFLLGFFCPDTRVYIMAPVYFHHEIIFFLFLRWANIFCLLCLG